MSPQNEIAKLVFDYWNKVFTDNDMFTVACDQGSRWGASKDNPARMNISLYTGSEAKSRDTQMSQADLAIINNKLRIVPYLVEIETGKQIRPKTPAGIISAINMCRWYYQSIDYKNKFDLSGVVLFILLCSEYFDNKRSRKAAQLEVFQNNYQISQGCLRKWIICSGHDVDSTFNEFKTKFESLIR